VKGPGFSINTLTLFGITLATGLVVDDAIVVIENVERHITEGISEPHMAASAAMKEVAGAVIATVAGAGGGIRAGGAVSGNDGNLFRQFALTIAFSVSISAFNALTLTPALSAIFLGKHRERAKGFFFRWFNKAVEAGTEAYRRTLQLVLGWRVLAVVAFLATLGLTYWIYSRVPRAFIPEDDQGYVMVIVQAPQGASLEYTANICTQIESAVLKMPDVEGTFSVVGFGSAETLPIEPSCRATDVL